MARGYLRAATVAALALVLCLAAGQATAAPKAFPTAEGYGAVATGGRGGAVMQVTTLADSGAGSLRACVAASGPRTCVFRIGGTITLNSELKLGGGNLTIAGQTAPGGGIALKAAPTLSGDLLEINRDDVIVRHVRFRRGVAVGDGDSINIKNAQNVILDHVSASWGVDENIGVSNPASNITIQWSIISEGLRNANNSDGPHSMGTLLYSSGSGFSLHHNLFVHNVERNPRINVNGVADIVNNLIHNPGSIPTVITSDFGPVKVNYVGNTYRKGTNSRRDSYAVAVTKTKYDIGVYALGNALPSGGTVVVRESAFVVSSPYPAAAVAIQPASTAAQAVQERAGAAPRDPVDARVVANAQNGSGAVIDSPSAVGGWPLLATGQPYPDADKDGMDDGWEQTRGLSPANAADRNGDLDADGYTNLEEFLNERAGDSG